MQRMRRAFTQIEVLVLFAIVAVLAGLLLPAIQKVREAASRVQCADRLGRIGTGFIRHHDARGAFPQGGLNQPGLSSARLEVRNEWAWGYHILPFAEYENHYREPAATILETPLPLYHCPPRRAPVLYGNRAMTDFAGCAGSDGATGSDGVVARADSPIIRMTDVTDGSSNTVMVAEKQLNVATLGEARDDRQGYAIPGWQGDFEAYRVGSAPPRRDRRVPGDLYPHRRFGSSHRAGFNVLFGDGTVRHLSFDVNSIAWQRACVRNDGDPEDDD